MKVRGLFGGSERAPLRARRYRRCGWRAASTIPALFESTRTLRRDSLVSRHASLILPLVCSLVCFLFLITEEKGVSFNRCYEQLGDGKDIQSG